MKLRAGKHRRNRKLKEKIARQEREKRETQEFFNWLEEIKNGDGKDNGGVLQIKEPGE